MSGKREITLTIDGQDCRARASFEAIAAIERKLGKLVLFIANLESSNVGVDETATFIHELVKAGEGKSAPSRARVGEFVLDTGIIPAYELLMPLLEPLFFGPDGYRGEAEEAEGKV